MQNDRITFWRLVVIVVGLVLAVFSNNYFKGDFPVWLPISLAMVAVLAYLIKINK